MRALWGDSYRKDNFKDAVIRLVAQIKARNVLSPSSKIIRENNSPAEIPGFLFPRIFAIFSGIFCTCAAGRKMPSHNIWGNTVPGEIGEMPAS